MIDKHHQTKISHKEDERLEDHRIEKEKYPKPKMWIWNEPEEDEPKPAPVSAPVKSPPPPPLPENTKTSSEKVNLEESEDETKMVSSSNPHVNRKSIRWSADDVGLIRDESGTHFRFRKHSIYDLPKPRPGTSAVSIRRSYGAGLAGPLIAIHLLPDEEEEDEDLTGEDLRKVKAPRGKIKLLGCIGVIIGCVLGSGIFAAPEEIFALTGSAGMTLIVWLTYGMLAMIAALCYVELGSTIPVSGGDYAYLNECFGPLPAFLFQWAANFVIVPTIIAIMSNVVAKNLVHPYVEDITCSGVVWGTRLIAIMMTMLVICINYYSSELTEKVQGWLMLINLTTIFLILVCGIVHISRFGIENKESFALRWPTPNKSDPNMKDIDAGKFAVLHFVQALFQASFAYFGYTYVTYIMEDIENPLRNLPLSICISIPIVITLNVFVNFCYLASIDEKTLKNTKTVASEMLKSVVMKPEDFPRYLLWIAPTLVSIAVCGGLLSNILTCSRVSLIGARNGHFPGIFAMTHKDRLTPVVSLVFMTIIGCCFIVVDIDILIGSLAYIMSAINCTVIYGLIYMRIKKPHLPRPFKLPLFVPLFYATASTFLFVTPIFLLDEHTYKNTIPKLGGAIFVIFAGIPVYFLFVTRRWQFWQTAHGKLKKLLQKVWLVLPEEMEIIEESEADDE